MKFIKENLKKINILILFISFILAFVFTCLSPHLFVKSEYWKNKYGVPEVSSMHVVFDIGDKYSSDLVRIRDVKEIEYLKSSKNLALGASAIVSNKTLRYPFRFSVGRSYNKYHLVFKSKFNSNISFNLPKYTAENSIIKYTSFKINGIEELNSLDENYSISTNAYKNEEFIIDIRAKYITANKHKMNYINWISLLAVFLIYTALNYIIVFSQIPKILKNKRCHIYEKFIQNKPVLIIIFSFFVFLVILNAYAGTHINFFARFWVLTGDANYNLMNIMYSTTKRFHPYAFLPFYPLFDILLLITKNFFISIFLIYTFITSLAIVFLYKTLEMINSKNLILNVLITSILGFSWIMILGNYNYDVYTITGFYLCLITYLIIKEIKAENKSKLRICLIGLLSAFSFGVTFTNIITILILLTPFLLSKQRIKQLLTILIIFFVCSISCMLLKDATCNGMATQNLFYNGMKNQYSAWFNFDYKYNFKMFKNNTLLRPIAENNKPLSCTFFFSWLTIVLLGFILSILRRKQLNKVDIKIFYSILATLIYNFVSVFFWTSQAGLLFSPNHFVLWFVLLGYSLKFIEVSLGKYNYLLKNNVVYSILLLFITLQVCNNYHENKLLQAEKLQQYPLTYNVMENNK